MGLAEVYFAMALLVGLAVPVLWPLVPVVIVVYVLMRGAGSTGSAVVEAAAPGDGCALVSGFVVMGAAAVVVAVLWAVALGGVL